MKTATHWKNLIKDAKGRRYKGFPIQVSLRNHNEDWNGFDFSANDLPLFYDNEDILCIHIYEHGKDGQLIDTLRIDI